MRDIKSIIKCEQWKELYINYFRVKQWKEHMDFAYKDGGINVTITTDKGNNRKITKGN